MFRLAYEQPRCADCRSTNNWPVCTCGFMRPLSDAFFVVPRTASISWSGSGPHPRVRYERHGDFTAFDLWRIREALANREPDTNTAADADAVANDDADDAAADAAADDEADDAAADAAADAADAEDESDFVDFVIRVLVFESRPR